MLDQLMSIVREASQEGIVNNPEVPNQYNSEVMAEAGNSLLTTLQGMMANGQASNVMSLFGSGGSNIDSNPITQMVSNNFSNSVSNKFGIPPGAAKAIAAVVIPLLISKFINRTRNANGATANGGNGGFDIQDIFNTISGGGTSGLNLPNILSKFTQRQASPGLQAGAGANPLDRDGDGDVDLADLTAAFSGVQQQPQQQNQPQGGGFFDQLKGLLG